MLLNFEEVWGKKQGDVAMNMRLFFCCVLCIGSHFAAEASSCCLNHRRAGNSVIEESHREMVSPKKSMRGKTDRENKAKRIYSGDPRSEGASTYVYLCRDNPQSEVCCGDTCSCRDKCNGLMMGVIRVDEKKNGGEFGVFAPNEDNNKEKGGSIIWSVYFGFGGEATKFKYFYNKERYNQESVPSSEKFAESGDIQDQCSFLHNKQGEAILSSDGAYDAQNELSIGVILKTALLRWKVDGIKTLSQLFEKIGKLGSTKLFYETSWQEVYRVAAQSKQILPSYGTFGWWGNYNCALFAEAVLCKLGALESTTGHWYTYDNSPESVVNRILGESKNNENLRVIVHTLEEVESAFNSEKARTSGVLYPQFIRNISQVRSYKKLGKGKRCIFLNTDFPYESSNNIPKHERVFDEYLRSGAGTIEKYRQSATIDDERLRNAASIQEYLRNATVVEEDVSDDETLVGDDFSDDRYDLVKRLVEHGADVDAVDSDGRTALMFAVLSENLQVVKFLIESGADINKVDNKGFSALVFAVILNNVDITKLLIHHGADVNIYF